MSDMASITVELERLRCILTAPDLSSLFVADYPVAITELSKFVKQVVEALSELEQRLNTDLEMYALGQQASSGAVADPVQDGLSPTPADPMQAAAALRSELDKADESLAEVRRRMRELEEEEEGEEAEAEMDAEPAQPLIVKQPTPVIATFSAAPSHLAQTRAPPAAVASLPDQVGTPRREAVALDGGERSAPVALLRPNEHRHQDVASTERASSYAVALQSLPVMLRPTPPSKPKTQVRPGNVNFNVVLDCSRSTSATPQERNHLRNVQSFKEEAHQRCVAEPSTALPGIHQGSSAASAAPVKLEPLSIVATQTKTVPVDDSPTAKEWPSGCDTPPVAKAGPVVASSFVMVQTSPSKSLSSDRSRSLPSRVPLSVLKQCSHPASPDKKASNTPRGMLIGSRGPVEMAAGNLNDMDSFRGQQTVASFSNAGMIAPGHVPFDHFIKVCKGNSVAKMEAFGILPPISAGKALPEPDGFAVQDLP